MRTSIKYSLALTVIAVVVGVFYLKVYIPKSTFTTLKPTLGDLQVSVKGIGNVSALNIYSITAQTGGKILEILADDGKWVKKDDLLVVMDGVDLPQQLEVAKANFRKSQFEEMALQSELNNQKAQKALLQITYNRYAKLKEQGFASASEYDKANTELKSIDAGMHATASRIDSAKAAVVVASKNIDALEVKIDRLKVYAPVDGYVISKEAEVAQNVLPSTAILKIVDPTTLWVQTKIDERISAQIELNQKATITLRSEPDKVYEGVVKRIGAMSDNVTLEREIYIAFEHIPKPFYINEQAEVNINVKTYTNIIKVPLKVIVEKNAKVGMWIIKDGHAHFLDIEKIAQNGSEIAISNGDENTQIIIPDTAKKPLSENMKINL
ncbi:efflux RND transporter periplasmic adaptor subunit [bacterium]|nr:efflux RND transporter periplasmic adaptor subunit [bacterium]MBU1995280.1 efflux RND transporter periplasmic adaptor subunit [bacterium]